MSRAAGSPPRYGDYEKAKAALAKRVKSSIQREEAWLESQLALPDLTEERIGDETDEEAAVFKVEATKDGEKRPIMLKKIYSNAGMQVKQYASDYIGDDAFYNMYWRYNSRFGIVKSDPIGTVNHAMKTDVKHYQKGEWVSVSFDQIESIEAFYRAWFNNWKPYNGDEWNYEAIRLFNIAQIAGIITADLVGGNGDRANRKQWVKSAHIAKVSDEWNSGNLMRTEIEGAQYIVPLDNSIGYFVSSGLHDPLAWEASFKENYGSPATLQAFFVRTLSNHENVGLLPLGERGEDIIAHIANVMTYAIQEFGTDICGETTYKEYEFAFAKAEATCGSSSWSTIFEPIRRMFRFCKSKVTDLDKKDRLIAKIESWEMTLPKYIASVSVSKSKAHQEYGNAANHPYVHYEGLQQHPYVHYESVNYQYPDQGSEGMFWNGIIMGSISILFIVCVFVLGLACGVIGCWKYNRQNTLLKRKKEAYLQMDHEDNNL
eukprot:188830_1